MYHHDILLNALLTRWAAQAWFLFWFSLSYFSSFSRSPVPSCSSLEWVFPCTTASCGFPLPPSWDFPSFSYCFLHPILVIRSTSFNSFLWRHSGSLSLRLSLCPLAGDVRVGRRGVVVWHLAGLSAPLPPSITEESQEGSALSLVFQNDLVGELITVFQVNKLPSCQVILFVFQLVLLSLVQELFSWVEGRERQLIFQRVCNRG